MAKGPFGMLVPDKTKVTLPSNGYLEGTPKEVYIRPIKGREELLMSSTSLPNYIDYIINQCTTDSDGSSIDPKTLTSQDKMFLLLNIRSITYSDIYTSQYVCHNSKCNKANKVEFKISELSTTRLDRDINKELSNVSLPKSGIIVTLKLVTDQDLLRNEIEAQKMSSELDGARSVDELKQLLLNMTRITSFTYTDDEEGTVVVENTPENRSQYQSLVENLPAGDIAHIEEVLDKANSWGVQTFVPTECSHCGAVNLAAVNLRETEFFRPSSK